MDQTKTVRVFSFKLYDTQTRQFRLMGYKAARDAITRLGGQVLEGTAEDVSRAALDERGRYRRIATGWGQL